MLVTWSEEISGDEEESSKVEIHGFFGHSVMSCDVLLKQKQEKGYFAEAGTREVHDDQKEYKYDHTDSVMETLALDRIAVCCLSRLAKEYPANATD